MRAPVITIRLDPGSPGIVRLEKLERRLERTSDLLKNIGEALLVTTDDRFDSETDPEGKAWAALRPLTVEIRGSASPILTRTGKLRGSVNYQVTGDTLKLGPNTPGAAALQFGAVITGKKGPLAIPGGKKGTVFARKVTIVPRPYIGIGKADRTAIEETAQDWFALDD